MYKAVAFTGFIADAEANGSGLRRKRGSAPRQGKPRGGCAPSPASTRRHSQGRACFSPLACSPRPRHCHRRSSSLLPAAAVHGLFQAAGHAGLASSPSPGASGGGEAPHRGAVAGSASPAQGYGLGPALIGAGEAAPPRVSARPYYHGFPASLPQS